jgi:predicted phosphodiesterase
MPKLDLLSDLHLDFYRDRSIQMLKDIQPNAETLVLAGDFCEIRDLDSDWMKVLADKYQHVLYVLGNHEYYGWCKQGESMLDYLHDIKPPTWTILNCEEYRFSAYTKIAGATLWYPDGPMNEMFEGRMADIHWIDNFKPWVYEQHQRAVEFFTHTNASIWITHHLPLWNSVHPKYKNAVTNPFFVGDLSKVLTTREHKPQVILHGHTHEEFDYTVAGVRVVCNPFGYPGEGRERIVPKLVEWTNDI